MQETIKPLVLACTTFPPMALRADPGVISTLWNELPKFLSFGPVAAKINVRAAAFAAAAVASVMYIAMSRGGAEEGSGEAGGGAVGRAAGKDSTGTAGKGKRSRR